MALSRRTGQRFQASIWPGFVDAMTGLLLVLMFVLTIFMIVQFVLRETITGQESELDQLSAEVGALASALGLAQTENVNLEARVGRLSATLTDTESELREQSALIASLTAERDARIADLDAATTRITGFEARIAGLIDDRTEANAEIDRLEAARAALEAQEAELLSEREALNLALATARSEIDLQTEEARLAAARREALEALVADLRAENADQSATTARLEGALNDLETRLSEEEAARLAEAAAAEALRNRLENADAELTALTLSLEAQRQEAEDTLTLLAAARAAEKDLVDRLAAALDQARSGEDAAARVGELEQSLSAAASSEADLRQALAQALEAQLLADQRAQEAEAATTRAMTQAERRAALLAAAEDALQTEESISTAAQRQTELLNQQVAALREQLGGLQALLDESAEREAASEIRLQTLGSDLNAALARAAAEERRARLLEEQERKRLEEEAAAAAAKVAGLSEEAQRLTEQAEELAQYRSEFFGRLRELLDGQEGVRVVGDRFVFSSEVLFAPGSAELSPLGEIEIAKVARILQGISDDIPEGIDWIIRVDGHTDNVPLSGGGQYADNWELSQARALSVVRFMVTTLGIPPQRLAANGFGEYQPLDSADTPEARARNRRIELKLTER